LANKTYLLTIFIIVLFCNSPSELRTIKISDNSDKEKTNKGILTVNFSSLENISINELTFLFNKTLTDPDKKLEYVGFLPYFQTVKKPTLQVNSSSNLYQGFLVSNKNYDFELEEGEYFGSIEQNGIESAFTLNRIRPFLYNDSIKIFVTIGYKSNLLSPTVLETIQFKDFSYDVCQPYSDSYMDSNWICPKINIKKNQITELTFNIGQREISITKTFFTWIPGIIFLVPIYNGSIVYTRNITVHLNAKKISIDKDAEKTKE